MFNRLNIEVLFQIIIEIFIAILIIGGLVTGDIHLLVHPKFDILLWIGSVILFVMAFFSLYQLVRPRHMNILSKYFALLIPIFVCMVIPVSSITNSSGNLSSQNNSTVTMNTNVAIQGDGENLKDMYKEQAGHDYINITDKKFLKWYYDMTFSWDKFEGTKFKYLAKVFTPKNDSRFVVLGRLGMVCCMADLQPVGFIYNGPGYKDLKDGQWFYVTSKIKANKKFTFNYEQLPLAYDVKLEKADKPIDEYVYINQ